MQKKRMIIVDIGSSDPLDISGKDVIFTDCPTEVLKSITNEVSKSSYQGIPAEELFFELIQKKKYSVEVQCSLSDIEVHSCNADY